MKSYLAHYLVAVKHPDVSAFEHLDMLQVRELSNHSSPVDE